MLENFDVDFEYNDEIEYDEEGNHKGPVIFDG